mgnify:CR=1 FL=1
MSRYLFEVKGDERIYIGWDNPLLVSYIHFGGYGKIHPGDRGKI